MVRKISQYIGEFKKEAILTPVLIALEISVEVIIPLLMSKIIDIGVAEGNISYVTKIGIIMLLCTFASLTFAVLSGIFAARASTGFARNLRKEMYHKIQDYSFSNIDKYSVAGLITRLTTDVNNVQNAFQVILRGLTRAPIRLFSAIFMSFYINARMALIFIGTLIFLGIALYFIITKANPYFRTVFQKYDKLNASVQENLNAIRVVKAYVREDHETVKFHKASEVLYKFFLKAEKITICTTPLMQLAIYCSMMLLAWFGAKRIVANYMTTGELMSLFAYTTNILTSLKTISKMIVVVIMAKSSADRIVEVIEEKSDLVNCENPVMEVKNGNIVFDNVSFSYSNDKNKLNLENINLSIKSGETIGIIGATGSAKSSLVQLIPRLYDVTEGRVLVGDTDVRNIDIETLRNEVSMVLQKNVLFSGSIKENLRWGDENASDEEIIKACKSSQADEFVQKFPDKYETYIEQGGSNVSGGQKQRLCIARALLKKPKILILDDSTSAVDTKTDALIRKAFKEDIPHTTKIIIAQRISSVMESDKIIVLNKGKVDGVGTHEELLANNEIYRHVYYSQEKGAEHNELIKAGV